MMPGSLRDVDARLAGLAERLRQYRAAGLEVSALTILAGIDRLLDERLTLMAAS